MLGFSSLSHVHRRHSASSIALLFNAVLMLSMMSAARAQLLPSSTGWLGYSGNPEHAGLSAMPAQPLQGIHWQTPVDLILAHYSGELLIHYGSPLITPKNTVVVTVRTSSNDTFEVQGYCGYCGQLKWTQVTDYTTPPHDWTPSCGSTLAPGNVLYTPAAGGTVLRISNLDKSNVTAARLAFYGMNNYNADTANYNANVRISTPITTDQAGNIYFGFWVGGPNTANLSSGLARIARDGTGTWVAAATAAADASITKVTYNCAPAISSDGKILYVAVNNGNGDANGALPGYLLALNSTTLATVGKVRLKDVKSGYDANLIDDGTATPTVGPDGDVYFGVLEIPWLSNDDKGWLLHFDKLLTTQKTPGAFGWDDTATIVPAKAVPSYQGTSKYLVLTKYNNYADFGTADGLNRVAVLDPNATMVDPHSGATVMKEVITVLGPTPNSGLPGVREWCINSAAIDPFTKCAIINSEDGTVYRWDFTTNTLSQKVVLTPGVGEAYTPTAIGPDGTAYAINDAVLFAVGSNSPDISQAVTVSRGCVEPGNMPNLVVQTIRVINTSGCTLPGPISLALDNLSPNAVLLNANGVTSNASPLGSPYITLSPSGLNPGDAFTVTLNFRDMPGFAPIFYTTRVLSGPSAP